jgi:hypothetical protein
VTRQDVLLGALKRVEQSHCSRCRRRRDRGAVGRPSQVDRVVIEPLPWPGDMSKTIDNTNLGKYFFEVRDQKTKRLVYSRGFASIFGEWETTDEARSMVRTFSESLRFPAPDAPVEITIRKRDEKKGWRDLWTTNVDPKDMFIDRSKPEAPARLIPIQRSGDSATKVDLLLLGGSSGGQRLPVCAGSTAAICRGIPIRSASQRHQSLLRFLP